MNDEEEGATEVMQESHPTLIEEEQDPLERTFGIERREQFESLEAANVALLQVEKADVTEEGREVSYSSSLAESRDEVIVGADVSVANDELAVGKEIEGEGLKGEVQVSVAAEIERGEFFMAGEKDEKFDGVGEAQMLIKEDGDLIVVEETVKIEETEEIDASGPNGAGSLTVAVVMESEFELSQETADIKVEKKESKMDERQEEEVKEMAIQKVDGGEEGLEVGDSSSPVARNCEDIFGGEGSLAKDGTDLEDEGERKEEVLPVTLALMEDEFTAGAKDVIVNDILETAEVDEKMDEDREMEGEGGSQLNTHGLLPLALQGNEMVEDGKTTGSGAINKVVKDGELRLKEEAGEMEVEEKKEIKMEERLAEAEEDVSKASPIVETNAEQNQAAVGVELGQEEEAAKVKDSHSFGKKEKFNGEKEVQTDKKQDDESNVGGETARVDEKMCGDREMEEASSSQLNADSLSPVILQDSEILEDGKTKASGRKIDLNGETEKVKVEVEEERQRESKEDMEMEDRVEIQTKDEEKAVALEDEMRMEEVERHETPKSGSGRRKRNSKSAGRATPRKIVGEDVCFICLDGGDLVLCDRRGCPKAYHPLCVDRDEAFFRSKGLWDCGWHLCRHCKKNAHYMCYTCQCSLCKGCLTDDTSFFCVRGSKGLCQTCMKTVMLIENNEGNDQMAAFNDTSTLDYLFKDYWLEQKEILSLSSDEIAMLINRWKRSNADPDQEMLTGSHARSTEGGVISDHSLGNAEPTNSIRKKSKKQLRSSTAEVDYDAKGPVGKADATSAKKRGKRSLKCQSEGADPNLDGSLKDNLGNVPKRKKVNKLSRAHAEVDTEYTSSRHSTEWASKELLEFVAHVKNGDKSALSQFDVQELILEHVKRNKLRDPHLAGQIVCDAMLQKLFGKTRVGHIEMLKLLESHFFSKEDSQGDDNQGSVLDVEISQRGTDENTDSYTDVGKSRGRKGRKRGGSRGLQANLDDYAAIDIHNIKLIYLRRNLIEALMEDRERFHEKVVGSFVRIRIIGSSQKQELHRLVQVIGTPEVAEPYKVGKRIAYCMLEILNLHKKEVVSVDTISNQDFDEDECKRLRQSIKCGFLRRLTVGDVLDKAKDLHVVRVTDLLETEITRFIHLRDRASDLGRKKQLRECVEKLQLLNRPEERQRRLDEIPEVHADPNMDPSYESEDESESDKGQDIWRRETWREREHLSSRRGSDSPSIDPRNSGSKSPSKKWEPNRSLSGRGFSSSPRDAVATDETLSEKRWSPGGDKMSTQSASLDKLRPPSESSTANRSQLSETRTTQSVTVSTPSETSRPSSVPLVLNEVKINETEKIWYYKDPTGKIQGPFSVVSLRKWNKSGYFPATLKIWRADQTENDSILLSQALGGKSEKELTQVIAKPVETPSVQVHSSQVISAVKIDPLSPTVKRSQTDPRFSSDGSQNHRPSSNSSQSISPAATGRTRVSRWSGSPTPIQLPSIATTTTDSSQVSRSSTSPSFEQKRAFDRSDSTQREAERVGSVFTQNPLSQSVTDNSTAVSTNVSAVQPSTGQYAVASAHGWNQNLMNMNPILTQLQQQQQQQQQQAVYSHWQNAQANNLPPPPPPPYNAAGQTMSSATFPAQNVSSLPSQAAWMSQVPTAQPNQAMSTTQVPANAGWDWAQMQQAYINMGWVVPGGPSPFVQYASQPGAVAGAAMVQASSPAVGMQPGNINLAGWVTPVAAAASNPGVVSPWNWQPPQAQVQAQAMTAPGTQIPRGQKACPYLMQGHCKKGSACDFRHT